MADDVSLRIVPPAGGTRDEGVARADDDGPAPLLDERGDTAGYVVTEEYPELRVHCTVEAGDRSVAFDPGQFTVTEDGRPVPVESVEFRGSALDLVFVFDDTVSMDEEIAGAKAGVTELTGAVAERGVDARFGLVSFKDHVEVDVPMTTDADRLQRAVRSLEASGGGDFPEANLDAIEAALDLDLRPDAEVVFVDITDATTHYRDDGSGFSAYTLPEVAADLRERDVTFVAVAPDRDDPQASIKTLAGEVGGLWTDIDGTRGGTPGEGFQRVLDRITSLLVSTYVVGFRSSTPPGDRCEVEVAVDHPRHGSAADATTVTVPGRFDRPPGLDDVAGSVDTSPGGVDAGDAGAATTETLFVEADRYVLPAGDRITFTVRDGSGDRLPGAVVEARGVSKETLDSGSCSFQFVEPGVVTARATHPDARYEPGEVTVEVEGDVDAGRSTDSPTTPDESSEGGSAAAGDDAVTTAEDDASAADRPELFVEADRYVLPAGDTLTVTVRDADGDRVPGAEVVAGEASATTGPRGTCQLALERGGTVDVRASVDDGTHAPGSVTVEVE